MESRRPSGRRLRHLERRPQEERLSPTPSDDGPFGTGRAHYFAVERAVGAERRRAAAAQIRILEDNLRIELERLSVLRARAAAPVTGGRSHDELVRGEARQERHVEGIRRELARQRRLRATSHRDRLVEWEVEHGHRAPPTPGRLLLARRSRKPFPTHPVAGRFFFGG